MNQKLKELRLIWEPENETPLSFIEDRFRAYMKGKNSGVSLLNNGTLIFTENGRNDEDDARRAMQEARLLNDFQVSPLKEGGFLVSFHRVIGVFVGQDEYDARRSEIVSRIKDLCFPGEAFFRDNRTPNDNLLVGLYARGKLQRDAHDFGFYKRIHGEAPLHPRS